jgi:hypothetical protein
VVAQVSNLAVVEAAAGHLTLGVVKGMTGPEVLGGQVVTTAVLPALVLVAIFTDQVEVVMVAVAALLVAMVIAALLLGVVRAVLEVGQVLLVQMVLQAQTERQVLRVPQGR